MHDPFLLNDYLIDPSRNTISNNGKVVDIQPKAMAVLLVLKGKLSQVVSHDQMMDEVWPNTVVNANTLQRCITQLRKALGDDGKQQRIIQTHAKQGYSLIGTINQPLEPASPQQKKATNAKAVYAYISLCILLISLGLFFSFNVSNIDEKLSFINPKPITSSDSVEHFASYSPDGDFVLFQRKDEVYSCSVTLWAKNLNTGHETQLLKTDGNMDSISWSKNGKQIAYTSQSHCLKPQPEQAKCWTLNTLDFSMAMKEEAKPIEQLGCYINRIAHARWITDNIVSILESSNYTNKLLAYNLITKQFEEIYSAIGKRIYRYDYHVKSKTFVVISKKGQNQHIIEKVDLSGKLLSQAVIQIDENQTNKEYFNSTLHPSGEFVVTYTSSGIRFIDFEGKITAPHYDSLVDLLSPSFHPNGNKIVATHMRYDTDIAVLKGGDKHPDLPSLSIIARSSAPEYGAKFQPNGHAIGFMSMRTGKRQLWINENNNERQITHAPNGLLTFNFLWSPDGKNIALVENGKLIVHGLNLNQQNIPLSHKIDKITQWLDNGMIIYIANNQLYQTNLSGKVERILEGDSLKSAYVLDNGNIFYIDDYKAMVFSGNKTSEVTELSPLVNANNILVKNNMLFGIDNNNILYHFDFITKKSKMLNPLNLNGVKLNDVNNDQVLLSYDVESQMEIIEFDVVADRF